MNKVPIIFVTGNAKKLEETLTTLGKQYIGKIVNKSVDLPEYQGENDEICRSKCRAAAEVVKGPVIIEDTSLGFNALGGLPGPYIKWFLGNVGAEGLHRMLMGWENKGAQAICTFAFSEGKPNSEVLLFQGKTEGTIVAPRGPHGFGWDPIFQPTGYNITYGEMPAEKKNSISHRGLAVLEMKKFLDKYFHFNDQRLENQI